ncbi:MAG TPA: radical SAM protein [Caldilineaceae bacterium]|nr:radical SAM protein [Caldilineaceae bacterium]
MSQANPDVANSAAAPRPASGALTKTGGFLAAFSHTLQPYIGCRFGCEYCYVQALSVHRFHRPELPWGEYVHPRLGIAGKLRAELARYHRRGELSTLAIFMSSATDPYQGAERRWRLSRSCLEVFVDFPPGLLIVQTRSPLVADDFPLLAALGDCCWLSFTLETDRDDVRRALTPRSPSIAHRVETIRAARAAGLNVQVAVSPCLPYSSVEAFGGLLVELGQRVVVDTYTSGDGQGGKRTAQTGVGAEYAAHGWGDWQSEEAGRTLYWWLVKAMGERAGWSQAGFSQLADRIAAPHAVGHPRAA